MTIDNPQQIQSVWDAFAGVDFTYASHDGTIREYGKAKAEREEQLPIRRQLLRDFLGGEIDVGELRSKMASEAGSHRLWGYSGTSGGMFFNLLISSPDPDEGSTLATLLLEVLERPGDTETAAENIRQLEAWVEQIQAQSSSGDNAPQTGYIPYFLSYFWQLQEPNTYPIYYRSLRDALSDLNLWEPSGDIAEDYVSFWELNEEIRAVLEEHTSEDIHLWQIERMGLFWLHRDKITDRNSQFSEEEIKILRLWEEAAKATSNARHFKFEDTYTPADAQAAAQAFIDEPSEDTFTKLWDPMHGAQRAGTASSIYEKWVEEKNSSDQELAKVIRDIRDADRYNPNWQEALGAKRTVWELFGLLHIAEYPIINGSAERGLSFFGFNTPSSYRGAVDVFENFKKEYFELVGHVTANTDHSVPLNYEIDQLLNVIDKVDRGDPETESIEAAAALYRAVLDVKEDEGEGEGDDFVVDPDNRRPPKAWQVGPDSSLDLWNAWSSNDVMAIGWAQLGDFSNMSKQEIADGLDTDTRSNDVTTIHYFANSIIPGDVVIARHGRTEIDGIGVVKSRYSHDPEKAKELFNGEYEKYNNFIDIEWTIDFVDEYDGPVKRPDSMRMFAIATVRGYSYYEELKTQIVDEFPDLSESFARLEARQSELSTEYWTNTSRAGEYDGIEEATEEILQRLERRGTGGNWIGDLILESVIRNWSDILRRNDLVSGDILPRDRLTIRQIYELYEDNSDRLEEQADEIGAGWIGSLTNGQLLFVVLLRDLQDRAGVERLNFNHVKMERLLSDQEFIVENGDALPAPEIEPKRREEIARQLEDALQVVFYGPPGTGKTFTARQFAYWWLHERETDPSDAQLETVTFHPSYTYEDFVEGLTAEAEDGNVEYRIEDGLFKRMCRRATLEYRSAEESDRTPHKYVLIIDEINRGNLAQIFGEMITLLEPDKRLDADNEIGSSLAHSREQLVVPPNLYLIGTMNTADRSIALVDAALRRRFRFLAFPPDYQVLLDHHGFENLDEVRQVAETSATAFENLAALSILSVRTMNDAILAAPDLGKGKQIGHSYLMNHETSDDLANAWKYEILPQLEEYFFGQFGRIQEELFAGGGDRLFHWEAEQIADFTVDDLRRGLAQLIDVKLTLPEAEAGTETETEVQYSLDLLLDEEIIVPTDILVFNEDLLPSEADRPFDGTEDFWRAEVTGKRGQINALRWAFNDEEYSFSGLAQTILEDASDWQGAVSGPEFWCHPDRDHKTLSELRSEVLEAESASVDSPE